MQDPLHLDPTEEDLSSEPLLSLGSGVASANYRKVEVFNLGGRITNVATRVVVPAEGISVRLQPSASWDTNGHAELQVFGFAGGRCPDCEFELSYSDKLGRAQVRRYRLAAESNKIELLPTTMS